MWFIFRGVSSVEVYTPDEGHFTRFLGVNQPTFSFVYGRAECASILLECTKVNFLYYRILRKSARNENIYAPSLYNPTKIESATHEKNAGHASGHNKNYQLFSAPILYQYIAPFYTF